VGKKKRGTGRNPDQVAMDLVTDYLAATRTQLVAIMSNPDRFADAYNEADHRLSVEDHKAWVLSQSGMTDKEVAYRRRCGKQHGYDFTMLRGWSRNDPIVVRLHQATLQAVLTSEAATETLPGSQLMPPSFSAPLVALPNPVVMPGSVSKAEAEFLGRSSESVTHERYDLIHIGPAYAKHFNDIRPIHRSERRCEANFLTLTFFGRLCDAQGVPAPARLLPDLHGQMRSVTPTVSVRIGTPLTDLTHQERLDHALQQITDTAAQDLAQLNATAYSSMDDLVQSTEQLLHLGLAVTTYLAAAESRTDTSPPRHYTLRANRTTEATVSVQSVGFATGRLIEKALAAAASDPATDHEPSGRRSPRPHLRRGHFKKVRFGKGLAETRIAWIAPTLVRPDVTPEPLVLRDPGPPGVGVNSLL
jgi:hypothetical protein